ncbi:hypothetical protein SMSP2_01591 [Limihaloglobus sulfuriphilus]|uniref:Lipopolysaccharide-assembly n=1 Tax=Limihaloglobus sulfuriphilus TaxID=1851148 RepID=A0A1Q2MEU6_9BACT|nr:LPS assembly lipoprotein LptE [Limihaloglobus sulfuriphilus]AQQ71225.1 hypothetical protein SMSP2_01591 [Limihaloglobus sulfuriphilus]
MLKTTFKYIAAFCCLAGFLIGIGGCSGYSQGWLFPEEVETVYVEMFDSRDFRRDYEYTLTEAVCKQIEVQTPYKLIADKNRAQTMLYGYISYMSDEILDMERYSGRPIEQEAAVRVVFSWKDMTTGRMYADNVEVIGACSYSDFENQDYSYAAQVAVNDAAKKILQSMQTKW